MMHGPDTPRRMSRRTPRPNPASTGRRLKRNVRIGDRRTTIVLEAYVWDSIDSMLDREGVSLDEFCGQVEATRLQSSMASSARLVVLTYFRLLEQTTVRPSSTRSWGACSERAGCGHRRQPTRRFRCCSWPSGALRKTKRVSNSLSGVRDLPPGRYRTFNTIGIHKH